MPAVHSRAESSQSPWTTTHIVNLVQRRLQKRPCWYQIEAAKAFYAGRDVIGCAPTGAGKTLSFWMPLLMAQEDGLKKILFVVSPLNVLAKQNVDTLVEAGISAIAIAAENATSATFKDVERGKYEVVVTNPEILVTSDELKDLWKRPSFTRRLLGFVFDEGHCISQWGRFRKHYLAVGIIRYLIPEPVPFYVASATLPPPTITEIRRLLHINSDNLTPILCSNDRPDVTLVVRELTCSSSSYQDLGFLIPYNWQDGMEKPKKFLVFFDDIKETEEATEFFYQRLLQENHLKVAWFHSTMSQEYREEMAAHFRRRDLWGLFCMDAFGLGMDIGDMDVVVQYKVTCDLCTLWQRFGRAARSPGRQGFGILLVEKKDTSQGRKSAGSKRKQGDLQSGRRQRPRLQVQPPAINNHGEVMEVDHEASDHTSTSTSLDHDHATWSSECRRRTGGSDEYTERKSTWPSTRYCDG
ncbi:hypothetical protein AGABI2DRAFT_152855 [Agaricus bisporus var. bisporus H97]|uniref:hypothetical protein n=1 Tax=Agaricus bisporus var. bisporus (strain H97 / ATCC MYA-4626 / FGSC 10389) TaxID=936046 RepID=UPI00029F7EFB|nr:hypothetical protein AGABI2DRAFT_152855 [Agaricus bisporus var. bisporus H97]EKV44462.1 hypothetical protein AGABI2DRAFT_152855 [Agaricus bisporus var. bisporus H97]